MKRERVYRGYVVDGLLKLYADSKARFDHDLTKRDGSIYLALWDEKRVRSTQANRFWWGCVLPTVAQCWQAATCAELPLDPETVHEALVGALLGYVETPMGRVRRRTSTLTVEDFGALIEKTAEYLREKHRVALPSPDEWEG